jgi:hypothetical protein
MPSTTATRSPSFLQGITHTLAAVTANCSDFSAAWEGIGDDDFVMTRWEGEWRSGANGHHGGLRCVLKEEGQGKVKAYFRAKYSSILRVCYSVELHFDASLQADPRRKVAGEADLGQLAGGVYRYEGELSAEEFSCNYTCQYDHGLFQLRRLDLEG